MKTALIVCLLAASLASGAAAQEAEPEQSRAQLESAEALALEQPLDIEAKLRIAASSHEIILALLENFAYDEILPEYRKILELDLGSDYENAMVQGAWVIVETLRENEQFALGHKIVTETLKKTSRSESRFNLLLLRGKIFKQQGQVEEALDAFREAQKYAPSEEGDDGELH